MGNKKVVPGSLTDAYKSGQGDFAPSLVGNQFTDSNAFFTLGNFSITTNLEGRVFKDFTLGEWSEYYSLNNLDMTVTELDQMMSNQLFVRLNFDKQNINRYVYFGSFTKFIESEVQDIILKWPASLYVCSDPIEPSPNRPYNLNTVLDYYYDLDTDTSTFKSPIIGVSNPFNLDFSNNIFIGSNIPANISDYILTSDGDSEEYVINGMTGYTDVNGYIYLSVSGDCFKVLSGGTFGKINYHIKPIKVIRDKFFNNLTDFQNVLLDRLQVPKYKAVFSVPVKYDDGDIGFSTKSFVWPTSDKYNIDIDTFVYTTYLESLIKLASLYDETKTDLVLRRFVSESIREYDTEGDGTDRFGMKVSKLLRVYGAEFDVVKKYVDGLSFANVVTYQKKDNTSDDLIKIMAKTLGFDVLLTLGGFNIVEDNSPGDNPQFSGYARELSPKEIDIELWRRLVINAWWLFRSKGTRKVLEFFMKLFNMDECLSSLNERVYVAKDKINVSETRLQLYNFLGTEFVDNNPNLFPFDPYGFPVVPRNTTTFWFQNDGFWYNGGNDRTEGNNPHYGPYDYGQRYWNRFTCFLEDFNTETIVERTQETFVNYFTEYNNGTFTPNEIGQAFSSYGSEVPDYLINPNDNIQILSVGLVEYGNTNGPAYVRDTGDTYSLRVTFQAGESSLCNNCPPEASFGEDGIIYVFNPKNELVPHNVEECCDFYWLPSGKEIGCPQVLSTGGKLLNVVTEIKNKECCTRAVVGYDVVWNEDKKVCLITKKPPIDLNVSTPISISSLSKPTNENLKTPADFVGNLPVEGNQAFYCYWCPPEDSMFLVCNTQDYFRSLGLTDQTTITLANTYGYNGTDLTQAETFLTNLYDTYFQSGKCFYMINGKPLKNKNCCTIRGGVWNEESKICEILPEISSCSPEMVTTLYGVVGLPLDESKPVSEENFIPLDRECCGKLNYFYGDKDVTVFDINGQTTTIPAPYLVDKLIESTDSDKACFDCPREIKENSIIDTSTQSEVIYYTDLQQNYLTKNCCNKLGFNTQTVQSEKNVGLVLCTKCDFNNMIINSGFVSYSNGKILDEYCCESADYYYVNNRCLECPPLEGGYQLLTTNISGVDYVTITDSNGNKLKPNCCSFYRQNIGSPNIIYDNNIGCYFI